MDGAGLSSTSLLNLNGGVLEATGSVTRTLGASGGNVELTGGASGFSAFNGATTVTINNSGNPLQWGSATFNPTSLVLNAATANSPLTFASPIDLYGNARTITVNGIALAPVTIGGNITSSVGVGGLTVTGVATGVLILTGNNTYNGTTSINETAGATLQIGNGGTTGTLGTGNVVFGAANILAFNRSDTGLIIANPISGTGILSQIGAGTTTLTGLNTYTGATNVNAGTLAVSLANQSNTVTSASAVTWQGAHCRFWASPAARMPRR